MSYLKPPQVPAPCARRIDSSVHLDRVDDRRSGGFHRRERRGEHRDDLGIRRIALVGLTEDADPRAAQAVLLQGVGVRGRDRSRPASRRELRRER